MPAARLRLHLSPIGLSFVTKVAPARIVSKKMGVWFLFNFIGHYMAGYMGTSWGAMPHSQFFGLITAIGVATGVALFFISRPMNKLVSQPRHQPGSVVG